MAQQGVRLPLTLGRKLVLEIMHQAKKVPFLPLAKDFNLASLVAARRESAVRPSWTVLFMKAYGLTARRRPELRRAYIRWPFPHLYEHPCTSAGLLIERDYQGEPVILTGKIPAPENQTLTDMDAHVRRWQTVPAWDISDFRKQLRLARAPGFLRRFGMWRAVHWSGAKREKHCGTFTISSLGNLGVEQMHPLTVVTTYLSFGPIDPSGKVTVKIIYDHRVMDGRCIARSLNDLEEILCSDIRAELRQQQEKPRDRAEELRQRFAA